MARARALIEELRRSPDPWQREVPPADAEALRLDDDGAVLYRVAAGGVSVGQLAARDERAAEELLAAARARGDSVRFGNVPAGDPASAALDRLGGTLELRQLELVRP